MGGHEAEPIQPPKCTKLEGAKHLLIFIVLSDLPFLHKLVDISSILTVPTFRCSPFREVTIDKTDTDERWHELTMYQYSCVMHNKINGYQRKKITKRRQS